MNRPISAEMETFLNQDRNAILATIKQDGAAQLTPVWYLYEDGAFYVSAVERTAKVRNLRRNPAITLCIDGGRGVANYVVVYGTATLVEAGTDRQMEMRRRIIRHYHDSAEAADAYYASIQGSTAALIVVNVTRIVAQGF